MRLFRSIRSSAVLSHVVILSMFTNVRLAERKQLDDYILHYEELSYDQNVLHEKHKRSIANAVHLELNAFNKHFELQLRHDPSVFAPNFVLEFNGTTSKPDISFLYSGQVKGHPGSTVHGAIIQGLFRGSFHIPSEKETYHVEKSARFFTDQPMYHSVIYKESDMNMDPFREVRTRERREAQALGTCGYENALKWMREVVQSEEVDHNRARKYEKQWNEIHDESQAVQYSVTANRQEVHQRVRRQSLHGKNDTCFLSLTSDVFLWKEYMRRASNNELVARDEILAFFSSQVTALKTIYQDTNFTTYDGTLWYSGVTFAVQKTKVMTGADCLSNTNPLYSFCQPNIDVSNFLNLNSLINHDEFCLAYVFTYRDFAAGTLGLAWVGAASSASGGVCERNKRFSEGSSQVSKSLNTGIVTTINYGKAVPSKVSQLTFAHEVGHNFGSPHDTGDLCAPYGTSSSDANKGNYIMFASATTGDKTYNNHFSPCSKDNITRVLDAVLKLPSKYNCFAHSGPFCGNGIVEGDEDCDCGFYDDCIDSCCIARNHPNSSSFCKLAGGAKCSPTQGPCCNKTCDYFDNGTVCRYESQCSKNATCNGLLGTCPESEKKVDGTYCNNYGFTCKNGECAASLCARFNWTECYVTGNSGTKEEQIELCKLGCKPDINSTDCILSSAVPDNVTYMSYKNMIDEVKNNSSYIDTGIGGLQLAPGSPCNNFKGYCDVLYRCRGVDAEGPLARLKNLIFNTKTLKDISSWIVVHWWAVLLMCIGLVIAMGLFIKCCAVYTPSSNPNAKPAKNNGDTPRRHHGNQNRLTSSQPQEVHHPRNPQDPPPYPGSNSNVAGSHLGPSRDYKKQCQNKNYSLAMEDINVGYI